MGLLIPYPSFPPPPIGPNVARFIKAREGYTIMFGPMFMCKKPGETNVRACMPDTIATEGIWQINTTALGTTFSNLGYCLAKGESSEEITSFILTAEKCENKPNQMFYIRELPDESLEFSDFQEMAMMRGADHVTSDFQGNKRRNIFHTRETESGMLGRQKFEVSTSNAARGANSAALSETKGWSHNIIGPRGQIRQGGA
ncbi:hypothetical protein TUBRATIS_23180 [Tubulinosema ratisbonensis]|uniref:Uncharacterized protein n=1 Tax=Tubulinosema ratisbonensis TaxID=291195 RepID=A0A437AJ98_9MICR|nr:hypothetical protein TUBRATIS_23180 [Tubulinosema ratisbonensis]